MKNKKILIRGIFAGALIIIADSFDAMNSSRVYRERLSKDYIINEFETHKGLQFDPKIADIMLGLIKDGKVEVGE